MEFERGNRMFGALDDAVHFDRFLPNQKKRDLGFVNLGALWSLRVLCRR